MFINTISYSDEQDSDLNVGHRGREATRVTVARLAGQSRGGPGPRLPPGKHPTLYTQDELDEVPPRLRAEREAQGLPMYVTDPVALAAIALERAPKELNAVTTRTADGWFVSLPRGDSPVSGGLVPYPPPTPPRYPVGTPGQATTRQLSVSRD